MRHRWLANATVVLSSSSQKETVTLVLDNLHFSGGKWRIYGISTTVSHCDLSALELNISFPEAAKLRSKNTRLKFMNCQLGKSDFENIDIMSIRDCSAYQTFLRPHENLLTLKNAKVNIANTTLHGHAGNALISAQQNSSVTLENDTFTENNMKSSCVYLTHSQLLVHNANFFNNNGLDDGGCILAANDSQIQITDSEFSNNTALDDAGAIMVSNNVKLNISRTKFHGNSAGSAGALVAHFDSHVYVSHSSFTYNSATVYTGTIKVYYNSSLTLYKSDLSHNTVQQSVAVASTGDNSAMRVIGCTFRNNTSQLKNSGALYVEVNTSMLIMDSEFVQNKAAQTGGAIAMYKNCRAEIYDSIFQQNSAGDASGAINIVDKCKLNVSRTRFLHNVASFSGGAISSNGRDQIYVSDSYFFNNTAHTGGGGSIANKEMCRLTVSNTTFQNNTSGYKGGALYFTSSKGRITDCNFTQNHAAIYAGAVVVEESNVTFERALFNANTAQSEGGAIAAKTSNVDFINCSFTRNEAVYRSGGVMVVEHESHIHAQDTTFAHNSAGYTGGVVFATSSSQITFESVQVVSNFAQIGGGFSLQPRTKFQAIHTDFIANYATGYTGVLFVSLYSEASFAHCSFQNNTGHAMAGVAYVVLGPLNMANTDFKHNTAIKGRSFYFFGRSKHGNHLYTCNTTFTNEHGTLSSDRTDAFWERAQDTGELWVSEESALRNIETPYASGTCLCHLSIRLILCLTFV